MALEVVDFVAFWRYFLQNELHMGNMIEFQKNDKSIGCETVAWLEGGAEFFNGCWI